MSEVDRLQALLARVQGNRRPAPPALAQVLASVGSAPAAARPAPVSAPIVSKAPTPSPAIASPVARKAPEPTPLEAALSRSPTPSPSLASPDHADPEIDVVMEVEEEDVRTGEFDLSDQEAQLAAERERAEAQAGEEREQREAREREQQQARAREQQEREARERQQQEREARERQQQEREERERQQREREDRERQQREREDRERQQREREERERAAARAEREAEERDVVMVVDDDESPTLPQPIAPLAAQASGPVARISRPLDTTSSTFGQLMRRTLALRPR